MTITEYKKKAEKNQLNDAIEIYRRYKECYKKIPNKTIFHEYFYLFEPNYDNLDIIFLNKLNEKLITKKDFNNSKVRFNSYGEFVNYCERMIKNEKNKSNEYFWYSTRSY